jgi:hypothetical protein
MCIKSRRLMAIGPSHVSQDASLAPPPVCLQEQLAWMAHDKHIPGTRIWLRSASCEIYACVERQIKSFEQTSFVGG